MKIVELKKVEHDVKIGKFTPDLEPNVTEDCIFHLDGKPIGFYKRKVEGKLYQLLTISNKELRSERVPKTMMDRKTPLANGDWLVVSQYSAILGSVPPKPHMRRAYPTMSSVHQHESANTFVKAMMMCAQNAEELISELMPEQYQRQLQLLEGVDKKWRFSKLFTSSISNYNIAAPYHQDNANIRGTVNVILTKRRNAKGGNLHIPDYGAVIDQCDGSILVYPAWMNVHGVTPIEPTHDDGYRNSLIFYALKAFKTEK